MLDAWTAAGGRWTCPDYEEDEARRTAFLDVHLESIVDGGGVTKNSCRVLELIDKDNIAVLIE